MIIIIWIVIFSFYSFLNWNCFPISSLMIWFYFLFVSNLILSFKIYIFQITFFFNFFSSLSLIILVGLEFYIVIFLGLPFTLWSGLMICVINFEGWTGFTLVIFNYFKKFHPLSLSSLKIDFLCFFYGLDFFVNLIFLFDFVIQFNIFFIFKVWHDTTCGFWWSHLILLMFCFLILFFIDFFPDFIILQFDSRGLTIIIFFSSLSIMLSHWFFPLFKIQW
jgi:hypothetical protein